MSSSTTKIVMSKSASKLLDSMPYLKGNPSAIIKEGPDGIPYNAAIPISNRKMQLVIPTHQRSQRQFTLKSLRHELQQEILVVTSFEKDAKEIRDTYGNLLKDRRRQVISIEEYDSLKGLDHINRIARKRQWIIENLGTEAVFQMDCDGYFFARCPTKYRHLVPHKTSGSLGWELKPEWKGKQIKGNDLKLLGVFNLSDAILVDAFRQLQDRLTRKEERYVHVGLSSRMGNNQEDEEWKVVGRAMHAIGHRRDTLIQNNIRFDEVMLREDFNVTLRLLQRGYPNAVYYTVCISPSDYGREGGASSERTVAISNQQAELLASMYPGFVKVVEKAYTYSEVRKEVQVYWDRIYKAAVAKKIANQKKSLF